MRSNMASDSLNRRSASSFRPSSASRVARLFITWATKGCSSPNRRRSRVERGSIQPLGLVVLSAIANDEREVVGDRGGVRVDFAQPPQIEIEHLPIEPLGFRQLPLLVEQDGQVVHRGGGLEMVGTEHLQPHVEGAPRDGDRRIDLTPGTKNGLEALEVAGDLGVLGAKARLVQGQRFALEFLRLVVLSPAREHQTRDHARSSPPRQGPADASCAASAARPAATVRPPPGGPCPARAAPVPPSTRRPPPCSVPASP